MSLTITIKVVPQAGRVAWKLHGTDVLKCYLKSPPEKNKANTELISLLAKALRLPAERITIIAGATSRTKRIKIDADVTFKRVLDALGIEQQLSLV